MLLYKRKTFAHEHEYIYIYICMCKCAHTHTQWECKLLLWVKMNFRWLQPEVHNFSWFAKLLANSFSAFFLASFSCFKRATRQRHLANSRCGRLKQQTAHPLAHLPLHLPIYPFSHLICLHKAGRTQAAAATKRRRYTLATHSSLCLSCAWPGCTCVCQMFATACEKSTRSQSQSRYRDASCGCQRCDSCSRHELRPKQTEIKCRHSAVWHTHTHTCVCRYTHPTLPCPLTTSKFSTFLF